jgi:hypothetical protein
MTALADDIERERRELGLLVLSILLLSFLINMISNFTSGLVSEQLRLPLSIGLSLATIAVVVVVAFGLIAKPKSIRDEFDLVYVISRRGIHSLVGYEGSVDASATLQGVDLWNTAAIREFVGPHYAKTCRPTDDLPGEVPPQLGLLACLMEYLTEYLVLSQLASHGTEYYGASAVATGARVIEAASFENELVNNPILRRITAEPASKTVDSMGIWRALNSFDMTVPAGTRFSIEHDASTSKMVLQNRLGRVVIDFRCGGIARIPVESRELARQFSPPIEDITKFAEYRFRILFGARFHRLGIIFPGFRNYCTWAESLQKSMNFYFDWQDFVARTPYAAFEKIHEKLDMLARKFS